MIVSTGLQTEPPMQPLGIGHFRKIAGHGFGDGQNTYAWSCTWYNDHLYIGTNRNVLVALRKKVLTDMPIKNWPVPVPEQAGSVDLAAQIWRYSPKQDEWRRVYRPPMVTGYYGRQVPASTGFRNMAVFQGRSDSSPAIYTIANCGSEGAGPVLVRSQDGEEFEIISEPGMGLADPNVIAFRGTLAFKGRLFTTPSGSRGGQSNTSFHTVVYCSDDPANRWEVSNPPAFGNSNNVGVFDLGVCGNYLYAGTINVRTGCELWKTDAEGPPPHRWTKVFDHGADRGQHNQLILSFAEFGGALYVGTGIQNGGYDRINNIGPAAAEVIRVFPDDSWDLVVGEPRLTRSGLKVPTSGFGPGFNNPFAGYIWRMAAHEGSLYVGNYDGSSFLPFSDPDEWPIWLRRFLTPDALDDFMRRRGGCDLWRTTDGDRFRPVTQNGFGNQYNWGIRSLISTPRGLFVGTANPFGPQVLTRGMAGPRYVDNPQGGLEVWHAAPEHLGRGPWDVDLAGGANLDGVVDGLNETVSLGVQLTSENSQREQSPSDSSSPWQSLLDEAVERDSRGNPLHHRPADAARRQERQWLEDPLHRLTGPDRDLMGLGEAIDEQVAAYFSHQPLRNVGYWRSMKSSPRQAAFDLLDELLANCASRNCVPDGGSIVLVAAGAGEAHSLLGDRWPNACATTVDLAEEVRWSTGTLPVAAASCDLLIQVESPSLSGNPSVLSECRRVVKYGGHLLLAGPIVATAPTPAAASPVEALLAECRQFLDRSGFECLQAIDITASTWAMFERHSREYFASKLLLQQIDQSQYQQIMAALPGRSALVAAYVVLLARRQN
jgi:hypothetical protein